MGMIIQNSKQYFPARGCIYQNGKKFSRMKDLYTASGIIASFETNDANGIVECNCDIPYNAQGYTSIEISARGINIWNGVNGKYVWKDNGDYKQNSNVISNSWDKVFTNSCEMHCSPNTTYCFIDTLSSVSEAGPSKILYYKNRTNRSTTTPISVYNGSLGSMTTLFTVPENIYYLRFNTSNYPPHTRANVSINYPSTYQTYHAPAATGFNKGISFGQTIYGGTFEAISGKLISKYNSDGSIKSIPDIIQCTTTEITALTDELNNIWSNCGEVTVKYYKSN